MKLKKKKRIKRAETILSSIPLEQLKTKGIVKTIVNQIDSPIYGGMKRPNESEENAKKAKRERGFAKDMEQLATQAPALTEPTKTKER